MLFETHSCKEFLQGELARRLQNNPRYSQRAFARHLGLSPGELSEILRGKRPLTLKSAIKIGKSLGLSQSEMKHLIYLVHMETSEEVGQEVEQRVPFSQTSQLTLDMFAIVSDWYCFAILNLMDCDGFQWNDNWIAKRLGVSPPEVKIALQRLIRLGLIYEKQGKYFVTRDYVLSPDGIPSEAIRNYHRQILSRASQALETQSVSDREITGITIGINPKQIPALRKEVNQFLDDIAIRFGKSKNKTEVYQLELALFRLTQGESL